MALRKPSELFDKNEASGVFENPEASAHITESYNKFIDNFETVNEISEKTKIFEKVNELSEKVEVLSQELSEKLTKSDLENAMLSQLMVLDENFKSLQNRVKGLNKQDLKEFKETVYNLTDIVENLVEIEIPKYKKKITKNEFQFGEQINQIKESVEENIIDIREGIDIKFDNIAEVVDNNIQYFNQKLEETSSQVKKTSDTYNKLSKIVEGKVAKENEKFEEYSNLIENLYQVFEELSSVLQEELSNSSQLIEDKFEEYKKEVNNIQTEHQSSVDIRLKDYRKELVEVKSDVVINEQHIKNVDKYLQEHHQELIELREEVFTEIEQIPVGNLQENIERLEKKIDYIKETYSKIEPEVIVQEVIKEGLLNEPLETKNSDPLTPLNQNFVTLDQLQEHYRLFINRIQQQLSTLGGGGETRLKYLDDIVGIATNASAYDGKFLKYDHSIGKFVFATAGAGAGFQTLDDTLKLGNTSSLGMSVGVITATQFVGDGSLLTNVPGSSNSGYANTAGIATYASIAGVSTYASTAGIATYASAAGIATYASTAGISTHSTTAGISTYASTAGIATYASTAGVSTYASTAGVSTYASTAGVSTYASTAGVSTYASTAGVSTYAQTSAIATSAGTATTATYLSDAANIITGTINKDRISTTNALTVLGDLYVSNNISFGGTTTQLNTQQLNIVDADIVLGIGTSFSPTDNTANHGGIAIASTEGSPLVDLNIVPGETNPSTYKKIMWFKGDTIGAGLTDAWLFNYAVGIGSTNVPNGVRLAVGNIQLTDNTITATTFNGSLSGNATTSGYATTAGISTYASSSGIATYASSSGIATYSTTAGVSTYASTAGIATVAQELTGTPNITVGVVTASSFYGDGTNLTGIVTSIVAGTNITISGSTGQVTINSTATGGGGSVAASIDLLEVMLFS